MRIGIRGAISGLVLASIMSAPPASTCCGGEPREQISRDPRRPPSTIRSSLRSATNCSRSPPRRGPPMTAVRTLFIEYVLDPARSRKAQIRVPVAAAGAADHLLGRLRMAGRLVLCGAQARRFRRRNDGNRPQATRSCRSTATNLTAATSSSKTAAAKTSGYVGDRSGLVSRCQSSPISRIGSICTPHPVGERLAAAFAGPIDIDQQARGRALPSLSSCPGFRNFLSQLTVGKTAGAFILDRSGDVDRLAGSGGR